MELYKRVFNTDQSITYMDSNSKLTVDHTVSQFLMWNNGPNSFYEKNTLDFVTLYYEHL